MFQILYFFTAFFYLFIGIISVSGEREKKAKYVYHNLAVALFLWALLLFSMYVIDDVNKINILRLLTTPFYSVCPPLFTLFLTTLARRNLNNKEVFILFLPAILNIIIYGFIYPSSPDLVHITSLGPFFTNAKGKGLIYDHYLDIFSITYIYISFKEIVSFVLFTETQRDKFLAKNIAISMGVGIFFGLLWDILLPHFTNMPIPRLGVIFFLPSMFFTCLSIIRFNFFDIYPEKFLSKILRAFDDGTIITNNRGEIEYFSPGALNLSYADNPIGLKIEDLFEKNEIFQLDEFYDLEVSFNDPGHDQVYLSKETHKDEDGDLMGFTYAFRDAESVGETQKSLQNLNLALKKKIKDQTEEIVKLESDVCKEKSKSLIIEETIDKISHYCPLTNLPNRSLFIDVLRSSIKEAGEIEDNLALIYFNIDDFKIINKDFGYFAGDEVLIKFAKELTDAFEGNFIARVGADEFALIVKSFENIEYIENMCQDIIEIFQKSFEFEFGKMAFNVSIGIALYPDDAKDLEGLMRNVDISAHKAKEFDGSVYKFVSPEMKDEVEKNFKIRNDLKEALASGELELFYQPQVDSDKGLIIGLEALIRWNHKDLGFLSPGVFLPIAEKYELMPSIDEFVLNEAVRQNKEWQDRDKIHVPVSVNLSPAEFMSEKLPENIKRILETHQMAPEFLELEITEGTLLHDIDKVIKIIGTLRNMGVKISIDDFGTEYSSLSYLKSIPASRLKIDKSFIDGIDNNKIDEAIIDAIIVLTDKIGIELIAEGVEEHNQMAYLRDKGCPDIQGFYYYKPMSVREIEETNIFATNKDRVI